MPYMHSWCSVNKQGKSEGFDSCDLPSNLTENWIQIVDYSACVTLEFDGWPRKIIGHLFYITSSFVHHFKSIGQFKLELQSGNAQLSKNWQFFCLLWPWNLKNDLWKQYDISRFVHHFKAMGEFKLGLQSRNAQMGSKSGIFCPVWPWNSTDDLEKQ